MRENAVKAKLLRGDVAVGTMVFEFASPGLPAILGTTGADFAIYDMEHNGLSLETLRSIAAWSRGVGPTPLCRVPAIDHQFISHALDVGMFGIMVPNVQTADEARAIVDATRYPPLGHRGAAFGFAHDDFSRAPVAEKLKFLTERVLVIAQIESANGLANVEEIAAVPGVDVLWVGHFDLTLSMGIPGQFESKQFLDAMDRVSAAAKAHGLIGGFNVDSIESGRNWIEKGYRMIAYQADFRLMAGALQAGVDGLRR